MNNDNVEMIDILKEQNPPLTGLPRYAPGSSGFGLRDDQNNAVSNNWYSIETPTPSVEDQTARIGDYVLQKGTPVVVPNSPTDLSQKYKIAIGGNGLTSQETVAQSVDMPSISGGAAQGAAIGATSLAIGGPAGMAVGALVGGLVGALNAYNTNAEDALKKWQEENIKYDTAVEFYRDDTGKLKYKLDYSKMGTGGSRSGEGIKEAQNRETQVSLGDDGRLKVTVSPIFASTARFQELVNWISENYAGLTKDTENYEQILEEIRNGIDGETQSYVTNMRLYADYANRFPEASPEAIVAAYMTEVSGYIDPEKMGDFAMSVIGTSGIETKTAKDFFDSVLNMSLDDRNRLLERLNDIVYGDNDYGANEKAVAYGELKALYTVARNPEGYKNDKYQGMLDADFFVTLMNSFSPLGLSAGDVLHFVSGGNLIQTKQEFLNQNDFARFVGAVGSVGAGFGLFKGATALIEKGMKLLPGTSQLFRASLEGQEGGALAFFAQNTGNTREVAKAATASAAFKTMKVGVFDAALAGSKTLVSGTDFWSEFGQDLARDAILEAVFSYYDTVQFQKAVNDSTVLVVRDPKTGNISKLPITEAQEAFDDSLEVAGAYNIQKTRAGEEAGIVQSEYGTTYYYNGTAVTVSPTGEVQKMLATPEGMSDGIQILKTGVAEDVDVATTELTTVEQTLERMGLPKDAEIFALPSQSASAAEVAGKIAKLDTTKAGLAINTNLFNKNAALDTVNEIALAKTGDLTAWQNRSQKFVSVLDNANQEINLMRTGGYIKSSEQAFNNYQMALGALNLTQRYTKTDANFLKAITQLERAAYLDRHKVEGDTRNYTAEALEKYGGAIAKVPDDRAAVLRDFNEKRKARHDATKASARKSGKIDIKKLDSFTDSDLQKEIGWVPQWGKKQTYNGLLSKFYGISQERNFYKEWLPEGGWVDLDALEDPIKADERFLSFVATNMGITDMIGNTASALDDARMLVDNTPTSETIRKRKLDSIKNKDELTKKFSDMVAEKKKEVNEKVMSQKQYKDWVLDLYKKYDIDGSINDVFSRNAISARSWDKIWKNASPEVRKTIRNELEKTSLQTGYGIKDTRARLNAQVPGADVLDWSLLGRGHTNGLVPGGLYAGEGSPVKAYIMSVDDLAKLAGYDLDNAIPNMGKVIESNINTKDAVPMLPAHIRGSGDGPEIWLKMRWGHNSDGVANWTDYLKTLKERGIEKVPVAIDDASGDYDTTFYRVRNTGIAQKGLDNILEAADKAIATGEPPRFTARDVSAALHLHGITRGVLRHNIRRDFPSTREEAASFISDDDLDALFEEAEGYDWTNDEELNSLTANIESVVEEKLGYVPQDITADVQRAFSEYGQIPFFRGQSGLGEFNMNDLSSTKQVGDAYWIAPNASYTDEYGKDKIMGTIPVKYFMSDKEKAEVIQKLKQEYNSLYGKTVTKVDDLYNELLKWVKDELSSKSDVAKRVEKLSDDGYIAKAERTSTLAYELAREGTPSQKKKARQFITLQKYLDDALEYEDLEALSDKTLRKELKKRLDVEKIIGGVPLDTEYSPNDIQDYRALAEYVGKPIIDISEDGFASGTAFFYYKGVSPEFDKEVGQQLATQALLDAQKPRWTEDRIANLMEEFYDGISLIELIESATGSPDIASDISIELSEILENGDKREADEYYIKNIHDPLKNKRMPGALEVADTIWYNNNSSDLSDYVFKYWNPGTGYPTISDEDAINFLEEMGEKPLSQSGEIVPEDQLSLWDTSDLTSFSNVPTEPSFRQPNKVTYNDYMMGIQADANSRDKIREAIKTSQINNLVKNVTSLLHEAAEYNKDFGYTFDTKSYLNTSLIPDLNNSISNKDKSLVAGVVNKGILDVAPYRSRSEVLKSAQESVAEEWRDWAEKHIKSGRTSNKELKKFAEDNDLKLPDDKRSLPSKIKHALWERLESGGKMPKIEGLDISKLRAKYNNTTSSVNKEKVYKYGTFPDYSILPKPGHSVLYTNTPTKNLDSIQEKGLLVGRNIEKYPKSPEEGMVIWTDSTNPTTSNYGGNTVAFQVPSEELKKYAVNDTQHTIPHNIRREDILFIDKMYSAEPLIKASNIMSYVEKYGRDKTISVLKNKGADEEEIRNLIDVRLAGQSESGVTKEGFYKMLDETPLFQSATKDKKELVDLVAAEINGETVDAYEMGAATRAVGMDGRYPITWYRKGKPYTRFITYRNKEEQRLAEAITELFTDKQLIKQPGVISRVASFVANDFRLLTTGFDPTRAPLNFARDTSRGQSTSGGQSFINPQRIFNSLLETGSYTAAEKEKLSKALDNVAQMVAGETYNAAYRSGRNTTTQATKQYLNKTGANPLRRFTYSLIHDKRSIAEAPADFFEGLTRKRLAKSAAVVKLRQLQEDGASFEEQLKGMVDSAFFAGREYTANFARKGKLIEQTSKYVAYQSSAYAGLNGMKMAFINNPEGVSKNFAVFLIAYLILLADTLGDEDSRKNYYRLSEYDRGNSLVISLGDDTVLTIPLDQEVAAFLFPYRRFMETLNGVDPVSFFEFVWGTLTEPLPMDLSGFSEGEGFNLVRGLQKLTSQNMPNILAGIQEASTGYDLYYGTDIRVTDETLKDYGIYNPEAGDYTTTGNNSALLRQVANITGIPQWQLQAMVNNYGGNVGQYVLNILDKLGGASEDAQGGKDFANAVFKSFVATDQDAAQSAFYDGIQQLQGEKRKLIQKIADYNEDIKTASGDAKVELQIKLQQAKDEYAVKVADFVDKYVSAYEITGGLPKSQAMQVYYLFRLDDDDTVYESGSPEEYYNSQAVQRFKNQATAMSAPILDRYYNNRIGNIYQDAEGTWRRYLSSGMQAMRNTIYGQGEEHMVGLLNILEGKDSKLKALRTQIKNARNKAYDAGDWTTRDALGYELDKAVVNAISPYVERYGAENVLGNSEVLDYLSDWFIVPDSFIKSKRGGHVSLANSGSTQEAFVRPYIKYVFGLPTNYYSYSDTSLTSPSLGEFGR